MTDGFIKVNLHTHSTMSDGELSPGLLASRLAECGVAYASLTDHDSSQGSAIFRETLARHGIGCIDGIELTAATSIGEAHILAYGIDIANHDLVKMLPQVPAPETRGERRNGPRTTGIPPVSNAFAVVHAAGGAAFLAHPLHLARDIAVLGRLVDELKPLGLDGLEAIYAGYTEKEITQLLGLADRNGLSVSAGGDFHESGARGQAESMDMPEARWTAFRDVLLRRSAAPAPEKSATRQARRTHGARNPLSGKFAVRIILPAVTAVTLFIVSLFFLIIPRVEEMMLERKKEMIRELTDSAVSILAEYEAKTATGNMLAEQAKAEAAARIRDLRYGRENKDYFWITDMLPRMIMHPYRTDLEGKDMTDFHDEGGLAVFVEFVRAVTEKNEGYVEYLWQWKDDANRIVPKLSFVRRFTPWNWVIGTGIYLEDVKTEINALSSNLIWLCLIITLILTLIITQMARLGFATELRRLAAETALRESRERYRALADGSTDGTVIVMDGACTFANEAFLVMTGYTEKEIQLLRVFELFKPYPGTEDRDALIPDFAKNLEISGNSAVACRLSKRSGETVGILVSGTPIALGNRPGAVLSVKEANPGMPVGFSDDIDPGRNLGESSAGESNREKRRLEHLAARIETESLWLSGPVSAMALEVPFCLISDSVAKAAARMANQDSDCILVNDLSGAAIGIVTSGDILRRSTAAGGDPETAIGTIMTAPIVSILSAASVSDAIAVMRDAKTGHVALRSPDGSICGVTTASDIALLHAGSFKAIREEALSAFSVKALADIALKAIDGLRPLAAAGARPRYILRALAGIQDAVTERLARLAMDNLGEPPASWLFMTLGSMGREESLPGSDQDNALAWIHSGGDLEGERKYFLAFAASICSGLEKAGLSRCKGGVMASNPAWNAPLHEWEIRLERSIREPEPGKILDLKILLDFRRTAGSQEIFELLREKAFSLMKAEPGFFIFLANDERERKTPGGSSRSPQGVNLKELSAAFTGFARVYALKNALAMTNTFDRLDALSDSKAIKTETRDQIADAHEAVMAMRLARGLATATQAENEKPGPLSARDGALLAFALEQAGLLQKRIGFDFLGSGL